MHSPLSSFSRGSRVRAFACGIGHRSAPLAGTKVCAVFTKRTNTKRKSEIPVIRSLTGISEEGRHLVRICSLPKNHAYPSRQSPSSYWLVVHRSRIDPRTAKSCLLSIVQTSCLALPSLFIGIYSCSTNDLASRIFVQVNLKPTSCLCKLSLSDAHSPSHGLQVPAEAEALVGRPGVLVPGDSGVSSPGGGQNRMRCGGHRGRFTMLAPSGLVRLRVWLTFVGSELRGLVQAVLVRLKGLAESSVMTLGLNSCTGLY